MCLPTQFHLDEKSAFRRTDFNTFRASTNHCCQLLPTSGNMWVSKGLARATEDDARISKWQSNRVFGGFS